MDSVFGTYKISGNDNAGNKVTENMGYVDITPFFGSDAEAKERARQIDAFGRKVFGLITISYLQGIVEVKINLDEIIDD